MPTSEETFTIGTRTVERIRAVSALDLVIEGHGGERYKIEAMLGNTGFLVPDASGLLKGVYAPADTLETANTPGLPFYAVPGEITARHVEWETESNVLFFCEKPSAIVNFQFA